MGVKVAFMAEEEVKKKGAPEKDKGPKPTAIIPKTAVRTESGKSYVFLLRDTKIERRGVTLGSERGSDVEIMAGVNSGDSEALTETLASVDLHHSDTCTAVQSCVRKSIIAGL